jgi:membrane-associated phospholipid phosphatase
VDKTLIIVLLFSLAAGLSGFASEDTAAPPQAPQDTLRSNRDLSGGSPLSPRSFVREFGLDMAGQFIAPFQMRGRTIVFTGLGLLAIAGLSQADVQIQERVRRAGEDGPALIRISPYVSEIGGTYGIAGIGVLGVFGVLAKRHKETETAFLMAEAALTSGLWCRLGKITGGRTRPSAAWDGNEYRDIWHGPFAQFEKGHGSGSHYDAFPSGHTTSAFSMAAVVAAQYGDGAMLAPAAAYTAAGLVGVARMFDETHWASDVLAGACLGYLCGKQVVRLHRRTIAGACPAKTRSQDYFCIVPTPEGAIIKYVRPL